ncbi:hypothetical protein [Pedobacter alpinus]|uniref:Uncharacterized protein n=1 Tax=Pedobacter alpinus TaxID=1590643 RepID=A0ABW5TQ97_9SPHI
MYSKKGQGNKFFVSHCGWSRSFANPYAINSENFPSPPLAGEQPDNELAIKKALSELESDILDLRNNKKTETKFFALKESYPYLVLVCLSIILGLLFFILKNRRLNM